MNKKLLVIGGVILALLLIGLVVFLFPRGANDSISRGTLFPSAGERSLEEEPTPMLPEAEAPEEMQEPSETPTAPTPRAPSASAPRQSFSPLDFLADLYARFRGGSTLSPTGTGATGGSGVGVPYTPAPGGTPAPSTGGGWTYDSSDPWIDGRPVNGDEDFIRFNPETLELWVGNVHFVFRGGAHLPDNSTSDVVGDPDNMVVGTTLGVMVGSLLGDPGLGLIIGSALGSNLYDGFMLQDIGIAFDNGMPSFGEGGSSLSGEGSLGGGMEKGFGGDVIGTAECTCSPDSYKWEITGTSEYAGTYVVTATTKKYGSAKTVGKFKVVGLYTEGTGSGQCMRYEGNTCEEVNISKGMVTQYSSEEEGE